MYIVRNKSLDQVYEEIGKKNLFDYSEDELIKTCEILKIKAEWNTVERNGSSRRIDINKAKTIELINKTFVYSIYMPQAYWDDKLLEVDKEFDLLGQARNHTNGDQTFTLFANVRIGIHNLKPNETAEVMWTDEYLKDEIGIHPISKYIEIKNPVTEKIAEFDILNNEKGQVEKVTLTWTNSLEKNVKKMLEEKKTNISEKLAEK